MDQADHSSNQGVGFSLELVRLKVRESGSTQDSHRDEKERYFLRNVFLWVVVAIPNEVARGDTIAARLATEVTGDTVEAEAAAATRIDAASVPTATAIIATATVAQPIEAEPILAVEERMKEMKYFLVSSSSKMLGIADS